MLHEGELLISICNECNFMLSGRNGTQITLSIKCMDDRRRLMYTGTAKITVTKV